MDEKKIVTDAKTDQIDLNLDLNKFENKRKRRPIIFVAAAILLALVVWWRPISGLFIKEQKTIKDYEIEAFDQFKEKVLRAYNTAADKQDGTSLGTKHHVSFEINQLALNMLQQQVPELSEFGALNDISLDLKVESDGYLSGVSVSADSESAELPSLNLQYDKQTFHLYLSLVGLTGDYLDFDLVDMSDELGITFPFYAVKELLKPAEFEAFLDDYYHEFIELMVEESVNEQNVKVEGVEQRYVAHEASIEYEAIVSLNRRYAQKLSDLLIEDSNVSHDLENAIEVYCRNLEGKDYKQVRWAVFIDNQGKIVGRRIRCDDQVILDYCIVRNKNNWGVSSSFQSVQVFGSGNVKDRVLNGSAVVKVGDTKYLDIKLDNTIITDEQTGLLAGNAKIKLSDEFVKKIFGKEIGLPMSFDVQFGAEKGNGRYTISYMDMINIYIDTTQYEGGRLSLPEGNAINGSDTNALFRWLQGIDMDKLKEELDKLAFALY